MIPAFQKRMRNETSLREVREGDLPIFFRHQIDPEATRMSARGARWLSPIAMNITVRIMGLLLAAVAIQFMLNALKQLTSAWLPGAG